MAKHEEPPVELRRALAFGEPLRKGIEKVREGGNGTTIVLGCDGCHEHLIGPGDRSDNVVSAGVIERAAADDGATFLDADLKRIIRKHTTLAVTPALETTSRGTRHQSAEAFARQSGHPVVAVSEGRTVTLYIADKHFPLRTGPELREEVRDLLDTLSGCPHTSQCESSTELARCRALAAEVKAHLIELGTSGRTLHTRYEQIAEALGLERYDAASASSGLVDRRADVQILKNRLVDGPWGVTLLRGTPGIGKTALVKEVLGDLARGGVVPVAVTRHDANAGPFDVASLVGHLEGAPDPIRVSGRSSLVRLEVALSRLRGSPALVVVDSAEKLLDPGTGALADPDLDEALEVLATEQDHRVTVLWVTQREPASPNDGTWPTAEPAISLGKLPEADFFTYLGRLGNSGDWSLHELSTPQRRALYGKLQGNPRLGELAHAVVVVADNRFDVVGLVAHLENFRPKQVLAELVRLLMEGLGPVTESVLQGIAAVTIPIPEKTVIELARPHAVADVVSALSTLVTHRIVHRADDRYFLPADDRRLIMQEMDWSKARPLYHLAADMLSSLRNDDPRSVEDLGVHFAELDALLEADAPGAAYETVESLGDILSEWNCGHLLFAQRKRLHGRLDKYLTMANLNAIADIHVHRGEYEEAARLYDQALRMADDQRDDRARIRLHNNLAGLYWEQNNTDCALNYWVNAREVARAHGDWEALVTTNEGIADCHRRQGRYAEAIGHAEVALHMVLGDNGDSRVARAFATSRAVTIALRLGRWCSELGDGARAAHMVDTARAAAVDHPNPTLEAAYQDGQADVMLYRGDLETAQTAALKAVDLALRQQDPVILLQARTTLCLLYLDAGRTAHARTEIELAMRYRRRFRALFVLALVALVAHRLGDRGTARKQFQRLHDESTERVRRDDKDFLARWLQGFAVCGLHLYGTGELDEAVAAFQGARQPTAPVPGLVGRMRFMVEQLDRDRLRPVLDVL